MGEPPFIGLHWLKYKNFLWPDPTRPSNTSTVPDRRPTSFNSSLYRG
jgi:hypothetical protein